MIRARAALLLVSAALLTGGCVAAAIPVVAGGAIVRSSLRPQDGDRDARKVARRSAQAPAQSRRKTVRDAPRSAERARDVPSQTAVPATERVTPTGLTALPPPDGSPATISGGGPSYPALWTYVAAQAARRQRGEALASVVLDAGATLDAPRYVACESKPLAILIDLDENPATSADPDARWRRWRGDGSDAITLRPGVIEGVEAARRAGVSVIFTSARSADSAPGVVAALDRLGLGQLDPGTTLWLRGAVPPDIARQTIAADHCVIALVGDAPADFSDLLPEPADASVPFPDGTAPAVAPLWGAGWFALPGPVRSIAQSSTASNGEK